MDDWQNRTLQRSLNEIEHGYGDRVHLLGDPILRTQLARLGGPGLRQPAYNRVLEQLYDRILDAVIVHAFPAELRSVPSREANHHPDAVVTGELLAERVRVTVGAVARAGTLVGQRCYERLSQMFDPEGIRLDHVFTNRHTSAVGKLPCVDYLGSKTGGAVDGRILLIPEPLAATGATMRYTLDVFGKEVGGIPARTVAMHLVVTPEYLRDVVLPHPTLEVFTLRVDRGLSSPEIRATPPGTHLDRERGLDDQLRIVPGLGAVGDLINNCFV